MDMILSRDGGALGVIKQLAAQASGTAGGTGDATTVTGISVDREGFAGGSIPTSVLVAIMTTATLGTSNTISVSLNAQDSANNSDWTDYSNQSAVVADTGPATAHRSEAGFHVNLTSARRYVRFNFLPDASAAGTDTFIVQAAGCFFGFDRNPAPAV